MKQKGINNQRYSAEHYGFNPINEIANDLMRARAFVSNKPVNI